MTIYQQMLREYSDNHDSMTGNHAVREVMQRIALAGLYRGGFFDHAAFYGGTCLRIFHGLPRFSEDMDFSLTQRRDDIHIENYFPAIVEEFALAGMSVVISKKEKRTFGRVESAFLKEGTEAVDVSFSTNKTVTIKIELDVEPPLEFSTEQRLLLKPFSFMTRCFTLPCLYAGKMHALVFRNWKSRVKGRDWYDFEWYVRNGVHLDFNHLKARIREFNGQDVTIDTFFEMLRDKLATTSINLVKRDVIDFIDNPRDLDIWSNDYFLQLATMVKIQ